MAEDIHNEGSEEEKKDNSQQDEDFGLPDLEFEELEELDLSMDDSTPDEGNVEEPSDEDVLVGSDDIDMSVLDDIEETAPASSTLDEGINEIEDVLDSAQLISDRLGDDEDEVDEEIEIEAKQENSIDEDITSTIESSDEIESTEKSIDDFSVEGMSTESVTGLSDEELEALMTPPEPVPDVESIIGDGSSSTDVDDLLASIDSPDDLAALGLADEDEAPEVNEEETASSSLFAADDVDNNESPIEEEESTPSESDVKESISGDGGSIFESDSSMGSSSIFESDSIALEATPSESENVDFQKPEEASLPSDYKPYTYDEATTGNFAKVIVVGVVIITLIGFGLLYFHNESGEGDSKKIAKKESSHKPTPKKKAKTSHAESTPKKTTKASNDVEKPKKVVKKTTPPPKKEPAKSTVQSAAPGDVVAVKSRTGRVYAIVGSFIDGDIAMDYAKKLSGQGKGIKIIHPYGKSINYRVTVADYASVNEATSNLENLKADYGDGVWALKY